MKPTPRSNGDGVMVGRIDVMFVVITFMLLAGCASSRRQRDYASLYSVVPGEEREDFARLVFWIAEHDGQMTLPVGGKVHWAQTAYYRWYSNETFVIVTCPPRFHETRSFVRWVSGSVRPLRRGVGWSLAGNYGLRGPGTYDFPGVSMHPERAAHDGVFGVRFGDRRERLLRLLAWHVSDQPDNNRMGAFEFNDSSAYDLFHFGWLRGYPDVQMDLDLTRDRRVGIISIRMPNSPSLAGLDFMKDDPPVLRQGFFVVDENLATKGLRQRPPVTKPRAEASEDHR